MEQKKSDFDKLAVELDAARYAVSALQNTKIGEERVREVYSVLSALKRNDTKFAISLLRLRPEEFGMVGRLLDGWTPFPEALSPRQVVVKQLARERGIPKRGTKVTDGNPVPVYSEPLAALMAVKLPKKFKSSHVARVLRPWYPHANAKLLQSYARPYIRAIGGQTHRKGRSSYYTIEPKPRAVTHAVTHDRKTYRGKVVADRKSDKRLVVPVYAEPLKSIRQLQGEFNVDNVADVLKAYYPKSHLDSVRGYAYVYLRYLRELKGTNRIIAGSKPRTYKFAS